MLVIRPYNPVTDYSSVESLYKDSATFGGQFDDARDSEERLRKLSLQKPNSILVAVQNEHVVGTVTLFEDGRSAWLYRFAVKSEDEQKITKELSMKALEILKEMGHSQVLVYAPAHGKHFEERYLKIGFTKGNDFTAYWQDIS